MTALIGPSVKANYPFNLYIKKIDASFSCVCPVIDHEFHSYTADYFDNVIMKFIINNWTDT